MALKTISLNLLVLAALLSAGCHSISQNSSGPLSYRDPSTRIHVERGRPNKIIDGTGSILGTPTKLALWDSRADNHEVSKSTETELLRYMDHNQLNDTLVRINQYNPWGEWKRLGSNDQIHPGWRYTVGVYNGIKYTLLPGRLLGGDWYNPFTNTAHIYSDLAPVAIARTAYAKDVRSQTQPGAYAASQEIPLVSMIHESRARNETLTYYNQFGDAKQQSEAKRIIEPDYGGSWGAQIASVVPYGAPVGRLIGAGVGHLTNRVRHSGEDVPPSSETVTCDSPGCDAAPGSASTH